MSRYMQQLSLWFFPNISELNCQFHYFPNPTNLIPELMVEPGGVILAAHGPQCQRERPVLPHPPVSALGWYLMRWHLPRLVPGSMVSSSEMSPVSIWSPAGGTPLHLLLWHQLFLSWFCALFNSWGAGPRASWDHKKCGGFSRSHSRTNPCLCDCSLPAAPQWFRATSLVHLGNEGHSTICAKHPSTPGLERGALLLPQGLGLSRQKVRLLQMPWKF